MMWHKVNTSTFVDTALEKWAKHGPFAIERKRMSYEYNDKSSRFAYQSLLALLMPPQIIISDKKQLGLIYVDVHATGFEPGKSTLTIDAFSSEGERNSRSAPRFSNQQQSLELVGWAPLKDQDYPSLTHGLRYLYKRPKVVSLAKILARAQHITKDSYIIPFDPTNNNDQSADPLFIDDKINGWAYAKPITIAT